MHMEQNRFSYVDLEDSAAIAPLQSPRSRSPISKSISQQIAQTKRSKISANYQMKSPRSPLLVLDNIHHSNTSNMVNNDSSHGSATKKTKKTREKKLDSSKGDEITSPRSIKNSNERSHPRSLNKRAASEKSLEKGHISNLSTSTPVRSHIPLPLSSPDLLPKRSLISPRAEKIKIPKESSEGSEHPGGRELPIAEDGEMGVKPLLTLSGMEYNVGALASDAAGFMYPEQIKFAFPNEDIQKLKLLRVELVDYVVRIHEIEGHGFTKNNPFVTVYAVTWDVEQRVIKKTELWKSDVLKKTLNPCWNLEDEKMGLDVNVLAGDMLSFELWHYNKVDNDFMGRVDVFPYLLHYYQKDQDVVTLRCDSLINHYLGRSEEKKAVLSPRKKAGHRHNNVQGALTLKLSSTQKPKKLC